MDSTQNLASGTEGNGQAVSAILLDRIAATRKTLAQGARADELDDLLQSLERDVADSTRERRAA